MSEYFRILSQEFTWSFAFLISVETPQEKDILITSSVVRILYLLH